MKTLMAAFFSILAFAQQNPTIFTNARPQGQHELTAFQKAPPKANEKVCGDYFVLLTEYPTNPPGIIFLYKSDNAEISLIGAMSRSKFKTTIDETKKVPTVEVVNDEKVINKTAKVIVRLSKNDYDKASGCLPKP